jgi:hypothetical protein
MFKHPLNIHPDLEISPVFGICGEGWCVVGDFSTKSVAIKLRLQERIVTACQNQRKTE